MKIPIKEHNERKKIIFGWLAIIVFSLIVFGLITTSYFIGKHEGKYEQTILWNYVIDIRTHYCDDVSWKAITEQDLSIDGVFVHWRSIKCIK